MTSVTQIYEHISSIRYFYNSFENSFCRTFNAFNAIRAYSKCFPSPFSFLNYFLFKRILVFQFFIFTFCQKTNMGRRGGKRFSFLRKYFHYFSSINKYRYEKYYEILTCRRRYYCYISFWYPKRFHYRLSVFDWIRRFGRCSLLLHTKLPHANRNCPKVTNFPVDFKLGETVLRFHTNNKMGNNFFIFIIMLVVSQNN